MPADRAAGRSDGGRGEGGAIETKRERTSADMLMAFTIHKPRPTAKALRHWTERYPQHAEAIRKVAWQNAEVEGEEHLLGIGPPPEDPPEPEPSSPEAREA